MVSSKTYIAVPPGATIKEQLEDRGMTQKEFAARMGMSEKHISHLINGEVQLTPDVANRLEMVLGLPASFWNKLEADYRDKLIKIEEENTLDEDAEIQRNFPYKAMSDYGWVPVTRNKNERAINLRKYFEVVRLGLLQEKETLIPRIVCRRQAVTEKADYALIAWAQKAKLEARNVDTSPINIEKLKLLLPEIRSMTTQDPAVFCRVLCDCLKECGIAMIFLPHIGSSFLNGATFYDGTKIVVGLTVRGKYADKFWFSLFHEIGHIMLGHIGQPEGTSAEDEKQADEFAKETLIPYDDFQNFAKNELSDKASIIRFARRKGIDPGIVVGRLQKENFIEFSDFNDLRIRYEISV